MTTYMMIICACVCLFVCEQQICDGEKRPHLCAFATTKIPAGEEIVFDYGDPDCPWRHVCKFAVI